MTTDAPPRARGTSNTNDRGNTRQRAARRAWLVSTFAADRPVIIERYLGAPHRDDLSQPKTAYPLDSALPVDSYDWHRLLETLDDMDLEYVVVPACRCYRCGRLLHAGATLPSGLVVEGTVTADRIRPGIDGGTYARTNIRPACVGCNSITGGQLGNRRRYGRTTQ